MSCSSNPTPPFLWSPALMPTWVAGVVSKPLDLLLDIIRGLAASCPPRGPQPQQTPPSPSPMGWLVPRGVLLSGPPGVGKTYSVRQTAKALAQEVEVNEPTRMGSRAQTVECGFCAGFSLR